MNKWTDITYLVAYLVTIIKKNSNLLDFCMVTVFSLVALRCHDIYNKWLWCLCVISTCWMSYYVNKLSHKTCLVMFWVTSIRKKSNLSIFGCLPVFCHVTLRCHDFWNKLSWRLCVIPICCIPYHVNKWTHTTYLVMYLVAIIKKKKQICRVLLAYRFSPKLHLDAPTFKINGREASAWFHYDGSHIMWTNGRIKPVW